LHRRLLLATALVGVTVAVLVLDLVPVDASARSGGVPDRAVHNPQWTVTAP